MGFSSPLQDVKGYSTSRPPLVVFVMCLLFFACSTLAMAFYIQYADMVLNSEIKVTWKKFLSLLDSLDLCVLVEDQSSADEVNAMSQFIDGGPHNSTQEYGVSITVAASMFLLREFKRFPQGMMAVSGRVEIDGFSYDGRVSESNLNMTFVIPRNLTETRYKDTCVILNGPAWLLHLSRRSNICIPSSINRTITHVGTLTAVRHNDTELSCRNGSSLKLNYNSQSDDEFFLSKEERWTIHIRLIHASYFLFIVAVVLSCYSLIRARMYSSVVKLPLTL